MVYQKIRLWLEGFNASSFPIPASCSEGLGRNSGVINYFSLKRSEGYEWEGAVKVGTEGTNPLQDGKPG